MHHQSADSYVPMEGDIVEYITDSDDDSQVHLVT